MSRPSGLPRRHAAGARDLPLRLVTGVDPAGVDPEGGDGMPASHPSAATADETLPPALALACEPIHKRAFGIAVGTALALVMFLVTAVFLLRVDVGAAELPAFNPGLLSHYFYGYTLSWTGAFIALGWGFGVGFVIGWFVAFCRNLVLAASIFAIRTRSELSATRDFLDHI